MDEMSDLQDPPRRGRGRPKGVRNKIPVVAIGPRSVPPGLNPFDDYRHADPLTLVSRQYAMFDWAQQALRNEIKIGMGADAGIRVSKADIQSMLDLSATLVRAMDGHKRALVLAEELAKQKTPAEILRMSIDKIKGQDLPTLQNVIRELREHRTLLAPITKREAKIMDGVYVTAVSAVASLETENAE